MHLKKNVEQETKLLFTFSFLNRDHTIYKEVKDQANIDKSGLIPQLSANCASRYAIL